MRRMRPVVRLGHLRDLGGAIAIAALFTSGCATSPRPAEASLRVIRAEGDAAGDTLTQVFIDERPVGRRDGPPIGLRAGVHRVELRAQGHFPAYREVTLARGDRRVLAVPLHPDLDHPDVSQAPSTPTPTPTPTLTAPSSPAPVGAH